MSSITASFGSSPVGRCCVGAGWGLLGRRRGLHAAWALVLVCLACGPAGLEAAEPAEAFLRELKARGYYELALEYLDRLEASGIAEDDFRRTIDFQQGEVLIQAALQQRTLSRKQAELDRAQQEFEKFTADHPQHALAVTAQGRLGEIVMERARLLVAQANQTTTAPQRGEELRDQARQLFDEAATIFAGHKAQLRSQLEQIPKALSPAKDAALIKERDRLRGEYVQAQFVAADHIYRHQRGGYL